MAVDITLAPNAVVGEIDRRLFGTFVEHLGRGIYTGIYEPDHPTATPEGFRGDVLALVRELGVTTVRYPGGNFVSSYRWEDGVGPRTDRPRRLDLAWHTLETNEVGTNEFLAWCRAANLELMMAVNTGTRGTEAAVDLLEYCNHPGGTALSDLRRKHGVEEPHGIRMWCLGNEMDGPWQIGQMTPDQYGRSALDMARAMRRMDPDLTLVACGSSGRSMPTFGEWERVVLGHCYDEVDLISAHAYYELEDGDLRSFLASGADMSAFIEGVVAAADEVRAARSSDKRIDVSFDEWNVWYLSKAIGAGPRDWPVAPRLLEDVYTVVDAVVVGDLLATLLRHADRVKAASLAQLVNVIAPIMTEPGGPAWRQATFHPFSLTAAHAHPTVLRASVKGPTIDTAKHGTVDAVTVAATWDLDKQHTQFLANRDPNAPQEVILDLREFGSVEHAEAVGVYDDDLTAVNTANAPERVSPRLVETIVDSGAVKIRLPAASWVMLRAKTA
ncbi:MAG: alpha-L-arabinofuranosidase [Demequinaceae bacterium]|nr:alpha-L-arabinofuranosidase [Demequinaceae bacterium]